MGELWYMWFFRDVSVFFSQNVDNLAKGRKMENPYYQLAGQKKRIEKTKFFKELFSSEDEIQDQLNDEVFRNIFLMLLKRFPVTSKLVGDKNFALLAFEYFKVNPVQSVSIDDYGRSLPTFLLNLNQMQEFGFLPYLAMLDWFWVMDKDSHKRILLPQGTLKSWSGLFKDQDDRVSIEINPYEEEVIAVEKRGKEYFIKTIVNE